MGSVPHIYTTGDNDPEIEPVSYYRHYLYCDACGSFALEHWQKTDPKGFERDRQLYGKAAWLALPLVVVPLWILLGFVFSLESILMVAAAMVISPLLRRLLDRKASAGRWGFVKWVVLIAVPLVWLVGEITPAILSPWLVLAAGALLIGALLLARMAKETSGEFLGHRCRDCGATYAYGSAFFTNLEANPRDLKIEDVPRPLGSSLFERGKSVET